MDRRPRAAPRAGRASLRSSPGPSRAWPVDSMRCSVAGRTLQRRAGPRAARRRHGAAAPRALAACPRACGADRAPRGRASRSLPRPCACDRRAAGDPQLAVAVRQLAARRAAACRLPRRRADAAAPSRLALHPPARWAAATRTWRSVGAPVRAVTRRRGRRAAACSPRGDPRADRGDGVQPSTRERLRLARGSCRTAPTKVAVTARRRVGDAQVRRELEHARRRRPRGPAGSATSGTSGSPRERRLDPPGVSSTRALEPQRDRVAELDGQAGQGGAASGEVDARR